jgi:hypothetical protein
MESSSKISKERNMRLLVWQDGITFTKLGEFDAWLDAYELIRAMREEQQI